MKTDNIFKYGFFIMIAVTILVYVFKGQGSDGKEYLEELEKQKAYYETIIKGLEDSIDIRDARIISLSHDLKVERGIAQDAINKRKAAIRYYEKRIKARDNLTTHELDSIFAKRYGLNSSTPETDSH